MEDIEAVGRAGRAAGAEGLLEADVDFDRLGLPLAGGLPTPSETDARGRVGEIVFARTGAVAAVDAGGGFEDVEDDKEGLVVGGADTFGARDALLLGAFPNNEAEMLEAIFGTIASLVWGADDELAAFLIGDAGAAGLAVLDGLDAGDFTAPGPKVPELITYQAV
jgi:hypothetical protein